MEVKQGDFVARNSCLDLLQLQLILLPQPRRAVAAINASLNRGKILLLQGLCVRRKCRKWQKGQIGGLHVEKPPFPGMTWNRIQRGTKRCEWKAPTRALFVSEVRLDLPGHHLLRCPIRILPLPLFEILSIMVTGQDEIGTR